MTITLYFEPKDVLKVIEVKKYRKDHKIRAYLSKIADNLAAIQFNEEDIEFFEFQLIEDAGDLGELLVSHDSGYSFRDRYGR